MAGGGLSLRHVAVFVGAFLAFGLLTRVCSSGTPVYENSAEVPGELTRFDSLGALPAVTTFAGPGAQLVQMRTLFVREDGTQDLEASYVSNAPVTIYAFVRPNQQQVDSSAPVGARGSVAPFEEVEVEIARPHVVTVKSGNDAARAMQHNGMRLDSQGPTTDNTTVAAPVCSFAQLWADAKARGAPAGAVVAITYAAVDEHELDDEIDGSPPTGPFPVHYDFAIDEIQMHLRFDAACKSEVR